MIVSKDGVLASITSGQVPSLLYNAKASGNHQMHFPHDCFLLGYYIKEQSGLRLRGTTTHLPVAFQSVDHKRLTVTPFIISRTFYYKKVLIMATPFNLVLSKNHIVILAFASEAGEAFAMKTTPTEQFCYEDSANGGVLL